MKGNESENVLAKVNSKILKSHFLKYKRKIYCDKAFESSNET
jgi:hypothetical protein